MDRGRPRLHAHGLRWEMWRSRPRLRVYVLDGEVEHTLGGQATTLAAGDLIVVPRGVPHRLINRSGAPVRAYIVFSSPDRQFVPTGE